MSDYTASDHHLEQVSATSNPNPRADASLIATQQATVPPRDQKFRRAKIFGEGNFGVVFDNCFGEARVSQR
jgi:hypothetical protein